MQIPSEYNYKSQFLTGFSSVILLQVITTVACILLVSLNKYLRMLPHAKEAVTDLFAGLHVGLLHFILCILSSFSVLFDFD